MKVHLQPQKDYWEMKGNLSDRVRPNCEAAPWVIEEIKKLEAMLKEPTKLMLIPELMKQAGWVIKQKPLTEEQIKSFLSEAVRLPLGWIDFARVVERAHGITNDPN